MLKMSTRLRVQVSSMPRVWLADFLRQYELSVLTILNINALDHNSLRVQVSSILRVHFANFLRQSELTLITIYVYVSNNLSIQVSSVLRVQLAHFLRQSELFRSPEFE